MNRTRIEIDPNAQRQGLVYALRSDATGPLETGSIVCAFESEEALAWDAEVVAFEGDYVALRVDAATMRDDDLFEFWHESFQPTSWWNPPIIQSGSPVVSGDARRPVVPTGGSLTR